MSCSFKVTSSLVAQLVESACNAGDLGSIPGLRRFPGAGKGYPLQYSGLENSTDCVVHAPMDSKGWSRLSNFHFHFLCMLSTSDMQTFYSGKEISREVW